MELIGSTGLTNTQFTKSGIFSPSFLLDSNAHGVGFCVNPTQTTTLL